jgi:hypothetical protein
LVFSFINHRCSLRPHINRFPKSSLSHKAQLKPQTIFSLSFTSHNQSGIRKALHKSERLQLRSYFLPALGSVSVEVYTATMDPQEKTQPKFSHIMKELISIFLSDNWNLGRFRHFEQFGSLINLRRGSKTLGLVFVGIHAA